MKKIRLSSRFHLAVGMTSLVVSVLLLAQFAGLVPDRAGAVRAGRLALAETLAVSSMALLEAPAPASESADVAEAGGGGDTRLQQVLGFVARRQPELRSVVLRRADGQVHLSVGEPPAAAELPPGGQSTDAFLRLPLVRGGAPWGQIELVFVPPRPIDAHWFGMAGSVVLLLASTGAVCFVLFYLYLRRMLRHLDPSRVVPGRVRTAFDTLAEGLLVVDPKGRIVLANRAFGEMLGLASDALVGREAVSLGWSQPTTGPVAAPWQDVFTDGRAHRNVLMHLNDAGGHRRTFMVNGTPVPGAGGRTAGTLVSLDDVTTLEHKEIELRLARDEAEAANRAKSDFLANMSHEIRTPMNAILGFAELLRRAPQHDPVLARRHLDTILGSGRHLLALINDILDLSKVEAGRLEVERVPCAVHEIVNEVADIMQLRAEEKGVSLAVEFPVPLPATVRTDPARVRQIVTNLVGNALKFTRDGLVSLSVGVQRLPDGTARLTLDVTDTGIGIASDKLDAIFEPFVQAEASTTRQFGGTGLGLAISRRFARALGGDITVTSVPERGSTFHVTLDTGPLDDVAWLAPAALAAAHGRVADTPEHGTWRFPARRVLVVDDGAENRELVRVVLEGAGLQVVEARDGAMALEQVERTRPDLVLMDVQMPVMDGYTATRCLRERGCHLPVLALTANAMKGFEAEIAAAGFTGYLTKPVDIDGLLAELARHLGGERLAAPALADARAPAPARMPVGAPAADGPPIVSRLAGHARLVRVVRTFGQTLPEKLQAMDAALAAGRLDELAALAHWLKGAGGTVGFDEFFEPARQFEQHARAGRLPELADSLRELHGLAARLVIPDDEPVRRAAADADVTA
jgi:PAS domain S-box-containing protein